jgi:hypothetical protein
MVFWSQGMLCLPGFGNWDQIWLNEKGLRMQYDPAFMCLMSRFLYTHPPPLPPLSAPSLLATFLGNVTNAIRWFTQPNRCTRRGCVIPLQVKASLPVELDFLHEAENSRRCAENLVSRASGVRGRVSVPAVDPALTTRRILTMDFIDGVAVTDQEGLARIGAQPKVDLRALNLCVCLCACLFCLTLFLLSLSV